MACAIESVTAGRFGRKHWMIIVAGLLITGNFVYVYVVAPKL